MRDLDDEFRFLDRLPESLYERVVTTRHGALKERVEGVLAWRGALLAGRLPTRRELMWPAWGIARIVLRRLDVMELPALCKGEESLTDELLRDICQAVESVEEWRERGLEGLFDDPLEQSRRRRNTPTELEHEPSEGGEVPDPADSGDPAGEGDGEREPSSSGGRGEGRAPFSVTMTPDSEDGDAPRGGSARAEDDRAPELKDTSILTLTDAARASRVEASLGDRWDGLAGRWAEIDETVKGVGACLGRGWDLSRGMLVSEGWREFVRLRRWIEGHPELTAVVDALGRERRTEGEGVVDPLPVVERGEDAASRTRPLEVVRVETPLTTQGVSRSDDIARMLPQEVAFLGHPVLHGLWHARRAERALLSYQVEGVFSERLPELLEGVERERTERKRSEPRHGPLLLCIDSSASMAGEPEWMAKAIALEVVRLGNEQRRACHLFTFSGPGQLLERTLTFNPGGLRSIIEFLQSGFHGGTDIGGPLARALEKIEEVGWERADMLLVSDGRFPLADSLAERMTKERESGGLRVQGVMVGPWSGRAMERICERVQRFESVAREG